MPSLSTIRRQIKIAKQNQELRERTQSLIAMHNCPKRSDEENNESLRIEAQELFNQFLAEELL